MRSIPASVLPVPAAIAVLVMIGLGMIASTSATRAAVPASLTVRVVDTNGIPVSDAVIELRTAAPPVGPIRFPWKMGMGQKNQQFVPGTLVVAKGSTVAFPNLDNVRHSIYSFSKPARFSIELYGRDQTRSHVFPIVGSVKLGCNIHDQMRGYIRVTDTPFAGKTDNNGYVTLTGMAAGSARITVWHPQLRSIDNETTSALTLTGGAQAQKIKVALR